MIHTLRHKTYILLSLLLLLLPAYSWSEETTVVDDEDTPANLNAPEDISRLAQQDSLSPKEKKWLAQHKTIRIGYLDNYMPYSGTKSSGEATGIVTSVIYEICRQLKISKTNKIQYIPFSSYDLMTKAMKNNTVDAVFPVTGNAWNKEHDGLLVTTPVVTSNMMLVFRNGINSQTTMEIAVNRNNQMQLNFTRICFPDARIINYNSIEECLTAVNNGEANSTIVNGIRINNLLKEVDYSDLQYSTLSKYDTRCFGITEGNQIVQQILNHGLAAIGPDYGKNAAQLFDQQDYTAAEFIRDHVLAFCLCVVIISVIIITLVLLAHRRTVDYLDLMSKRNEALERAQHEAEYANSAKTKFLSSMAHDIRTPMNAIIGFTNLAQDRTNDPVIVADYLKKISISSRHLLSLINQILDMSRIESGKIQLAEEELSVSEAFNNLRIITEEGAKQKNIDMTFHLENITDNWVITDKLRLCQIFINIIGNAIKYTNEGGWIRVTIRQLSRIANRATYTFTVKDNGIGMSADYVEHIFEAFTRERTSTVSKIQGTGLGMSITKSLVDMMGGKIEVHSEEGVGSEFIVTMSMDVAEHQQQDMAAGSQQAVSFDGLRILVVEDNELNQEIATMILQEMGFDTDVADNGKLAVEAVSSHPADYYDIILMDIQMPVMDGYDATRAIRALGDTVKAAIPIVAMTANAFDDDKRAAFDAGMNAHVAKPVDPAKLIEELHKVLIMSKKCT